MNRSPLCYPLNRAGDADAGGAADLQTDIMRFMAILALCLVAVFALVQSIPLTPTVTAAIPVPAPEPERLKRGVDSRPPPVERQPKPVTREPDEATPVERPRSAPATPPVEAAAKPAPVPNPVARTPVAAPAQAALPPMPAAPPVREPAESVPQPVRAPSEPVAQPTETRARAPADAGFTLRFESDAALARLVARNEVGLYAISPQRSLRMSVNRGAYTFWPASAPRQFHEMDPGTVPDAVVAALRRSGALGLEPTVQWGVTLPADMRRQLDGYLAESTSGKLVIEPDGRLRLEP